MVLGRRYGGLIMSRPRAIMMIAVLFAGFVGHVEGAVQFAHEVVLPGGDPLKPLAERGDLPVVLLLFGAGGVRDELGEALFAAGGQGVGR